MQTPERQQHLVGDHHQGHAGEQRVEGLLAAGADVHVVALNSDLLAKAIDLDAIRLEHRPFEETVEAQMRWMYEEGHLSARAAGVLAA